MKVREIIASYLTDRKPHVAAFPTLIRRSIPINAWLGDYDIFELTPEVVAGYHRARAQGKVKWRINGKPSRSNKVADSTVRAELVFLTAARNWAWRTGLLGSDKLRPITLPAESPPRERWLLRDEAMRYLAAAQPSGEQRLTRAYRLLCTGLYTGARRRAIEELTWDRIRLNLPAIEKFAQAEAAGRGDEFLAKGVNFGVIDFRVPGRKVTKKRNAVVPINPDMALVLHRAHKERESNYWLDHPGCARTTLRAAASKAGLTDIAICHVLRHTFATWAAQEGLPLIDIAAALGDTLNTVEKRYAHHHPDFLKRVQARRIMPSVSQVYDSTPAIDKLDW